VYGHFGPKTFRHYVFGAEVSPVQHHELQQAVAGVTALYKFIIIIIIIIINIYSCDDQSM